MKLPIFSLETFIHSLNTPKLWKFQEILLFVSALQQKCFLGRFLKIQSSFIQKPMCSFEKTQILNIELFEKPYYSSRNLQQKCYVLLFLKRSFFLRNPSIFQKAQTLNLFGKSTISVAFYGKFATSWINNFSDTWSTNVGSFTRSHLANMG